MCLIAIAHRVSERFPLVIAANRDEDYDRPTHDAHFWTDASDVLGGRDAVADGSWLAVTRTGRFAAVTNLRGAVRQSRSRGALVRDFVMGTAAPRDYAPTFLPYAAQYAGFHLFAGASGGDLLYATPDTHRIVEPGVHAVSNAPAGEQWPKVQFAADEMKVATKMDDAESIVLVLMQFLGAERGSNRVESEVFIKGDRYGTRASTVAVFTPNAILFGEQSFTRGGVPYGKNRLFRIELAAS